MKRSTKWPWSNSASAYMVAPNANSSPEHNTLNWFAAVLCSSGPGQDQTSRANSAATGLRCGRRRAHAGGGYRRAVSSCRERGKRSPQASAAAGPRSLRLPARITGRQLLATAAALCTIAAAGTAVTACEASIPRLCPMNTSRGAVPGSFPIVACVDGSNIWLSNTSAHVLSVTGSGDIKPAWVTSSDSSFGSGATRDVTRILYRNALILLPGDKIQVPIGSGAAEVRVSVFGPADVFYALAKIAVTSVPRLARIDTFTQFATAITADFNNYRNCKNGQNFLGQALCLTRFTTGITKVALQLGFNTPSVLGVLLAANTFLEWTGSAAPGQAVLAAAIDQARRQ
jgi:hypothetical protein